MPFRRILPLFVLFLAAVSSAQAQTYRDGLEAFRAGQVEKAYEIWNPLAEAGDALAQFGLALIYERGSETIPQDLDAAVKWYELAVVQGVAAAQNNLGHMYSQGLGVQEDKARAVELWREAAKAGHSTAYYNLGLAYFRGDGTEKNEIEATRWFAQAADAGLKDGQFAIGEMYRLGIGTERNESRALGWYKLAAAQGHVMGRRLAVMLEDKGVRPSSVKTEPITQTAVVGSADGANGSSPLAPSDGSATDASESGQGTTVTQRQLPQAGTGGGASAEAYRGGIDPRQEPSAQGTSAQGTGVRLESVEAVPVGPAQATSRPRAAQQAAVAPGTNPVTRPAPQPGSQQLAARPAPLPNVIRGGNQPGPSPAIAKITGATPKGVHIWLASMKSSDDAEAHWKQVRRQHGDILDDLSPLFTKVDLGSRGIYYRVMVGPIENRADAQSLCQQMRSSDPAAFCKVLVR
ncbi:MAG: SPOR domain-containing protein [Kiloniellales bacterium]|nr:SPOR domain-containing protein [Kiloniellales bacterium]